MSAGNSRRTFPLNSRAGGRNRLGNTPAPGRAPYLLSAILFPSGEPPAHGTGR
ncbi:hypothetical protein AB0J71_32405 [Nonomuraea sp. NPDC049637]|uniref:hypothetical protein n=1 Tax=Nonomuraea sp. NPDC049637 TaxID=3154356 RepID=UPI003449261F